MKIKNKILNRLTLLTCIIMVGAQSSRLGAQTNAFTYQGQLTTNGVAVSGSYDLRFALYDAATGGSQQAITTNLAVAVSSGLFTTTIDLGSAVFTNGADRWLEIASRTNGGGTFGVLAPRQQITSAPYAIVAKSANNLLGNVSASQLTGTIPAAQLGGTYSGAVSFTNTGSSFSGSFAGSGANVTNVNAATLGGLSSAAFWKTNGNAGANPANGAFLGTSDNLPLEFKVNGMRALRIEPGNSGNGAPNVIGGSPRNFVAAAVVGATIAGGGATNYSGYILTNSVSADFGAIGGGIFNTIQPNASSSTIGGGYNNSIQTNASYSTIGGGEFNAILHDATNSTIGGGYDNTIQPDALFSTIGGGQQNTIWPNAPSSTIGGGFQNTNTGSYATVPGGDKNVAGTNSLAAGHRAKATHTGSFVWADSTETDFASTGTNQFLIRASGGVGIGTNNPQAQLHVAGDTIIGGMFTLTSSTVVPTNNMTLHPTTSYIRLNPTNTVTLNTTTAIADGSNVGNILILENTNVSFTVTITNTANTKLGTSIRTLAGPSDNLTLLWDGNDWVLIGIRVN